MTWKRGDKPVRLSDPETEGIRAAVDRVFGGLSAPDDPRCEQVIVFGSRARMEMRGGDLDLAFRVDRRLQDRARLDLIRKLKLALEDALGEQKMDLVVIFEPLDAFQKVIMETGVTVWMQSR